MDFYIDLQSVHSVAESVEQSTLWYTMVVVYHYRVSTQFKVSFLEQYKSFWAESMLWANYGMTCDMIYCLKSNFYLYTLPNIYYLKSKVNANEIQWKGWHTPEVYIYINIPYWHKSHLLKMFFFSELVKTKQKKTFLLYIDNNSVGAGILCEEVHLKYLK